MALPDFTHLFICSAEGLDDQDGMADSLLGAARSANLGVFVWDIASGRLIWNESMYRVYGLPYEVRLDGNEWLACLHPDDLLKVRNEVIAALKGERPYDTIFRIRANGGGWRYVRGTAWIESDADGQPVRMAGINQDITESHRFNLLVDQVQTATLAQVGLPYLRALTNALSMALGVQCVFVVAESHAGIAPAKAKTLAISIRGESGEHIEYPLMGSPCEQVVGGDALLIERNVCDAFPQNLTLQALNAQCYMGLPLVGADGAVLGLICLIDDKPLLDAALARRVFELFTGRTASELERIRHEADIRRLNAELELRVAARTEHVKRTLRELEAFTYAVSRDLNAPLRAVHGFGSVLREDYADRLDDTGRDCLERTLGAAERMGRLLDDLVNLSKISLRPLNVSKVNLSQLASDIVADLQNEHGIADITITIAPYLSVHADPGLMRILLDCLLRTAWRFLEGYDKPSLQFTEQQIDGRRELVISENGRGFEAKVAERMFAPFQSLGNESAYSGGGAALAIAQRVVHRHHGEIRAESPTSEGVRFIFWLPSAVELLALLADED